MKQEDFEQRFAPRWDEFARWLDTHRGLKRGAGAPALPGLPAGEVPARYRELCQHLALARDRQYSAELIERLSRLALSGHQRLYGAHGGSLAGLGAFLLHGFPRAVRGQLSFVLLAALLFFGPLLVLTGALQRYPDFAYTVLDQETVEQFEAMYGDSAKKLGRKRDADTDTAMFGFYIFNNIRIGFQTFAGGLAFGLGAVFYLLYNGLHIGTVTGYLIYAGLSRNFFSFVAGHGAFELTAIVLCGAAGLRLGWGLIAPGRLRRIDALRAAAVQAVPLVGGAAIMLVGAAAIEAFWSPRTEIPPPVKYAVGGTLWALVLAYFAVMGRRRGA
jgi:uncharacterized membrane protein SpoIIM required for sporulation